MHTRRHIVYALTDPRTETIRYVGKSSTGMERPQSHRLHLNLARDPNLHKVRWIQQLQALGLSYRIDVLEEVGDGDINAAEIRWIAYGRAQGWPLTNLTNGGDGQSGRVFSAETRAKMSAVRTGKKASATTREKIRQSKLGRSRPDRAGQPFCDWTGRSHTDETRAKIRAALAGHCKGGNVKGALLGRTFSPESIARMSAGQRARREAMRTPRMRMNLLGAS